MKTTSEKISKKIADLMEKHEVGSQSELADVLGVSRALINGILLGRNEVTLEQALRFDSAFDEFDVEEYFELKAEETATDIADDLDAVEEKAEEEGLK